VIGTVRTVCGDEDAERLSEINDALADARLKMAGMVDGGDLQRAERALRYIRVTAALRLTDSDEAVMRDFMRVCDEALEDEA
jgi:hypothetical protein